MRRGKQAHPGMGKSMDQPSASTSGSRSYEWTPRRLVVATLIVVAVVAAFALLVVFRLVVFSLFAAIVIGTAVRPVVDWLGKRGVPRSLSAGLVFVTVALALVGMLYLFVPLFQGQGAAITSTLSSYYQNMRNALAESPSLFIRRFGRQMPLYFPPQLPAPPQNAPLADQFQPVLDVILTILRGLFVIVATLLLTFYWVLESDVIIRSLLLFAPNGRREGVRDFVDRALSRLGAYTRGLLLLSLAVGGSSLLAYTLIGLPNSLLLGFFAGVMEAVPMVGPILGALPAVLIALALAPSKILWVALAAFLIQQLENTFLVPRIMGKAVGVNPFVTLLALTAFGSLFGILGALLAIPLTMIIQMIFNDLVLRSDRPSVPEGEERNRYSVLRYEAQELIQDIHKQVRTKEEVSEAITDHIEDAIEAVTDDLVVILRDTEPVDRPEEPAI